MVEGNNNGHPVRGVINDVAEEMVLVDFNHPLSGMDLNFDIELVEVD
jgi:FKBP-type peptidyl-prolyl cis-trans isomerase 2